MKGTAGPGRVSDGPGGISQELLLWYGWNALRGETWTPASAPRAASRGAERRTVVGSGTTARAVAAPELGGNGGSASFRLEPFSRALRQRCLEGSVSAG